MREWEWAGGIEALGYVKAVWEMGEPMLSHLLSFSPSHFYNNLQKVEKQVHSCQGLQCEIEEHSGRPQTYSLRSV